MKRSATVFYTFILLLFVSCTQSEELESFYELQKQDISNPYYVSYEQALEEAIDFLQGGQQTRSTQSYDVANHYEYVANLSPRNSVRCTRTATSSDSTEVRFHVINFANDGGFTLVAADRRTTPIYAFSDKGHLDLEEAIANTGVAEFMASAIRYYKDTVKEPIGEPVRFDSLSNEFADPAFVAWVTSLPIENYLGKLYYTYTYHTTDTQLLPLAAQWGQKDPYNYYCPARVNNDPYLAGRAPVGCVATAISQIMSYFEYPLTITDYNNPAQTYTCNWSDIKLNNSYSFGQYTSTSLGLARIMHQTALYCQSVFNDSTTTSSSFNAILALNSLGYTTSTDTMFHYNRVISTIQNNHMILAGGYKNSNHDGGHDWVIDGYNQYWTYRKYYRLQYPYHLYDTIGWSNNYLHCNWGWNGNGNGYYLLSSDNNKVGVSNPYYYMDCDVIYDIHPNI